MKGIGFFSVNMVIFFLFYAGKIIPRHPPTPQNHAPVVKIKFPLNHAHFIPGAMVHYSISVADAEDGDSKYQEIKPNEVFLAVKEVPFTSTVEAVEQQMKQPDAEAFTAIRTNNCFNCHAFDEKKIAPSFLSIAKKYTATSAHIDSLAKHIRDGSSGIWGTAKMPSHPELSRAEAEDIARWILKNAADTTVDYLAGLDGSFTLPSHPGSFVLTASYLDHGVKPDSTQRLRGEDVIAIEVK